MLWNQCLFSATPREQSALHCKPDLLSHLFTMHWFSLNFNGIFWIAFVFDFVCTLIRLWGQRWIPDSPHHRRFPGQNLIVAGLTPCCFRNLFWNRLLWTYRDYVSLMFSRCLFSKHLFPFYLFDDSSLWGFLFSMYSHLFPDGVCLAHVFDRWCQGRFSDGSGFKSRSPLFLVHGIPCFLTISLSDHLCFDAYGDKNVYLCFVPLSPDRWHEKFAASFPLLSFDSSRGYPGEGPNWICTSANIDSMNFHPDIFLGMQMLSSPRKLGLPRIISTFYNKMLNNRANRYFQELFFMKNVTQKDILEHHMVDVLV